MKQKTLFSFAQMQKEIQRQIKHLKRKKMILKIKAVLFIVLPIFIVLIGIKLLKTYLRIRLREFCLHKKDSKKHPQSCNKISQTQKHPEQRH